MARTDLDAFSDARLDRDLQDELDDVFDEHSPDAVADVATIQAAIMAALQDEGDGGLTWLATVPNFPIWTGTAAGSLMRVWPERGPCGRRDAPA